MTKPSELPLYLITFKLLAYLYHLIHNFPKEYKYTLGQSILDLSWEILDLTIQANNLPNCNKYQKICEVSNTFDRFKGRLRMAYELKLISNKKYGFIVGQLEEIGAMINGWNKWAIKQTRGPNK